MAKAFHQNRSDGEERKLGEQSGLDIENLRFSELLEKSLRLHYNYCNDGEQFIAC